MRFFPFVLIFVLVFLSCQEQVRYCDENNVAEFCFNNTTSHAAKVSISGLDTIFVPAVFEFCEFIQPGTVEYAVIISDSVVLSDSLFVIECQFVQLDI